MTRSLPVAALAGVALLAFAAAPTLAISPSEAECLAAGGDFSREQGEVQCVFEENVGNSENSQTTTTTKTGRGNSGNKPEESCVGPGTSTSSAHCK